MALTYGKIVTWMEQRVIRDQGWNQFRSRVTAAPSPRLHPISFKLTRERYHRSQVSIRMKPNPIRILWRNGTDGIQAHAKSSLTAFEMTFPAPEK